MHTEGPGFESALDFTLAPALDPQLLSELPEPALTVMLNRSEGTHDFTLFGAGGFKSRASFDVLEVQDLIRSARAGLRRAAWGDEDEWRDGVEYLYGRDEEPDRLRRDLVELAKRGFRFYASIADRLASDGDAFALSDRLARPGSIQIASFESPRQLLPEPRPGDGRLPERLLGVPAPSRDARVGVGGAGLAGRDRVRRARPVGRTRRLDGFRAPRRPHGGRHEAVPRPRDRDDAC